MNEKHLNTLEFPKILERLARYAAFSASKELALALVPTPYFAEAQARQIETAEAFRLLTARPETTIGGARDVRPHAERANRGAILEPLTLLEVRQTLISARELQRTLGRLAGEYPHLADITARVEACPGVVNEIGQAIEERGEVKSNASSALARIRRELETAQGRLMEKLNRIISSSQYAPYLQEALITQRAGRYVVPVKAQYKGRVQGVVHDQSASGATVFVEPISTVDLNNQRRRLQVEEENEIRRILAELSDLVGQHHRLIRHTVDALADFDLALAKARYAEAIEAFGPQLIDLKAEAAEGFELMAARHPLLDPKTVVPVDISLSPETRLLVITGPNTGGKTVTLKTIGLLAVMAQAGLWIPAREGSRLPVFNHILADIGDEQSIEQSLSTFSAHMTNIVRILARSDERSLVILDELGAGTDPVEGSALARSILIDLLQRRVTTFVATHFSDLKAFASTTEGVANASMAFDPVSLAPTYRLEIGLPGASNAFTIARRLGLTEEIIEQARTLISEDARQMENMLAEIRAQNEAIDRTRAETEQEREQARAYTEEIERRLAEIETEREDILANARADARREIKTAREEIRALKERAEAALRPEPSAPEPEEAETEESPAAVETVETELASLDETIAARETPPAPARPEARPLLRPGDKVFIPQFQTTAEVLETHNKELEVQLGHFRATVATDEVELRERADRQKAAPAERISTPAVESPGAELDLRGQVADEALHNLDQYLDQAFMAGLPWVRIIHGKGSGTLRQAVRQALSEHPMIDSYRAGNRHEGGEGVTVGKLALG